MGHPVFGFLRLLENFFFSKGHAATQPGLKEFPSLRVRKEQLSQSRKPGATVLPEPPRSPSQRCTDRETGASGPACAASAGHPSLPPLRGNTETHGEPEGVGAGAGAEAGGAGGTGAGGGEAGAEGAGGGEGSRGRGEPEPEVGSRSRGGNRSRR